MGSNNVFRGRAVIDEPEGGQALRHIVHSCSACLSRPATIFSSLEQVRAAVLKQSCERLIELLKNLCESHGEPTPGGIRLNIKLCQDELAALAGVSRRSLNRGLARLRKLGILEPRRGLLVVRDIAALHSALL